MLLVTALTSCRPAAPGFTLLFFRGSSATRAGDLAWAPDLPDGKVLAFDQQLHITRVVTSGVAQPVAVALPCGRVPIVSEYTGSAARFDSSWGSPTEFKTHFPASVFASAGCRWIEARSPYLIEPDATDTTRALVVAYDIAADGGFRQLGPLHQTTSPSQVGPQNAGAVALDSTGAFYFAPAARDEIVKYSPAGVPRWTSQRGLSPKDEEPAGLALSLGPDGRLYSLSVDDRAGSQLRVDVLDTARGAILFTRHLGPHETAVAIDAQGTLHAFDADSLVEGGPREPLVPAFALPNLAGDTVHLSAYAGKVTLVNFWASWCVPCRDEFPHMTQLYGQFSRKDFDIAAISDDETRGPMEKFLSAFHPPFPVLWGRGRMRETYHYRGLPYSVLLDRHGHVVERILGFGGEREFQELRAAIAKEIAAP